VLLFGVLANIVLHTGIGRHMAVTLWRGLVATLRFVFYDGVRGMLRWPPLAELLNAGIVRGLGRNLVQPLLIGSLPLIPIIALAVFVEEVPIEPGLWLPGWPSPSAPGAQYAGGASLPGQPVHPHRRYLRRINQALFIGAIQQLLYFFKEVTGASRSCCTGSTRR
jgi:hypothetical protein